MNNNRNDFFTGAGFDEGNQNNQPVNNGMMNQQPMPQMQNDNMFGGMQQPMMDNSQMMNQQPMMGNQNMTNPGMMNQPMYGQPNGNAPKGKLNINLDGGAKKVLITVVILVLVLVLVFVFGHKTLSCTQEMDYGIYEAEMTAKIEYWFGKATSKTAIMKMNLEDLDEDEKEQVVEMIEELAESTEEDDDNISVKVKESGDTITLTAKQKITDDDEVDSYDDEREAAIDADYVCK